MSDTLYSASSSPEKTGERINTHKSRKPSQNERVYWYIAQYCCENPFVLRTHREKLIRRANKPKGLRDLCGFFPRQPLPLKGCTEVVDEGIADDER